MKKTVFNLTIFMSLILGITIVSCNKKETSMPTSLLTQEASDNSGNSVMREIPLGAYTYNELFQTVLNAKIKYGKDEALYITFERDESKDKSINVVKVEKKVVDYFPVIKDIRTDKNTQYQVHCDNGDNSWTENCNGTISCGNLIKDCLDQGGCATICTAGIVYLPPIKTFHITQSLSN